MYARAMFHVQCIFLFNYENKMDYCCSLYLAVLPVMVYLIICSYDISL